MSGRFRWKKQPQMGAGAGKVSQEKVAADGGAKPVEKQRARTLEMKRMAKLVPELRATAANVNPGLFEISEADSETAVDQLRAFMCACNEAIASAQSALDILLASGETPHATSRAGFLRSLPELIGPPPERSWQDEWEPMMIRSLSLTKGEEQYANAEFVQKNESIAKWKLRLEEYVASLVRRGWPFEQAETFALLSGVRNAMGRAMRDRDPQFAASTYALSEALYAQRGLKPACARSYRHRTGRHSLTESDAEWERLTTPDRTGFRGLTCSAVIKTYTGEDIFTERGFRNEDSDVVAFEHRPPDEHGEHAPVALDDANESAAFPPNTLYRLKQIMPAGTWSVVVRSDTAGERTVFPQQRLLVVSATYRAPRDGVADDELPSAGGKMCSSKVLLQYASRAAYVNGLHDVLDAPTLTMAREFARRHAWSDWKGDRHTLRGCWEYVTGAAAVQEGCAPGTRDANNHGCTPTDFLERANEHIRARRKAGHGLAMPEEHALLTLDEVLAVRLYSGPAYEPINDFLRTLAKLSGRHRLRFAKDVSSTYAATVRHIVDAIRKLAAIVTPEEAMQPLYRGVRGELPDEFWRQTDDLGMTCATDSAFMSTSRHRDTPIDYMGNDGGNVLWSLQPQPQSDSGYHRGADISLLSQFAGEKEVLFPPCTMMLVQHGAAKSDEALATDDKGAAFGYEQRALESSCGKAGLVEEVQGSEARDGHANAPAEDAPRSRRGQASASTRGPRSVADRGKTFTELNALPCFI